MIVTAMAFGPRHTRVYTPAYMTRRLTESTPWVLWSASEDSGEGEGGQFSITQTLSTGSSRATQSYVNTLRVPVSFIYALEVTEGQIQNFVWGPVTNMLAGYGDCDPYCEWAVVLPAQTSGTLFQSDWTFGAWHYAVFAVPWGDYRDNYDSKPLAPPLLGPTISVSAGWYDGSHDTPSLDLDCALGQDVYAARDGVVWFVRRAYSEPCYLRESDDAEDPFVSDHCIDLNLWPNIVSVLNCDGTFTTYSGFDGPDAIDVTVGTQVSGRQTVLGPCGRAGVGVEGQAYNVHIHVQTEKAILHELRYPFPDSIFEDDADFECGACADAFIETSFSCSCFDPTSDDVWEVDEAVCDSQDFGCRGDGSTGVTCTSSKKSDDDGGDAIIAIIIIIVVVALLLLLACYAYMRFRSVRSTLPPAVEDVELRPDVRLRPEAMAYKPQTSKPPCDDGNAWLNVVHVVQVPVAPVVKEGSGEHRPQGDMLSEDQPPPQGDMLFEDQPPRDAQPPNSAMGYAPNNLHDGRQFIVAGQPLSVPDGAEGEYRPGHVYERDVQEIKQ